MSNFPCFLEWAASFWNLFKLLFIYLAFVRYLGEFFFIYGSAEVISGKPKKDTN